MPISKLEHVLSYHLRWLLPKLLNDHKSQQLAYFLSLISALTSGFLALISLYSITWLSKLHYTSMDINTIGSIVNFTAYISPPFLGLIANKYGPITLGMGAIMGFIPSYYYLSFSFTDWVTIRGNCIAFGIIGVCTSALYFSALLTCTKLYPKRKILCISLPTTCIGLSGLLGSQLLNLDWFWFVDDELSDGNGPELLNLPRVFRCLMWLYVGVGITAWVATSVVSIMEYQEELKSIRKDLDQMSISDNDASTNTHMTSENEPLLKRNNATASNDSVELDKLVSKGKENLDENVNVLFDCSFYLLGIIMLLTLGPVEMFVTDMNSLKQLINNDINSNTMVSMFAITSTASRILMGLISDYLINNKKSLKLVFIPLMILALGSQLLILFCIQDWSIFHLKLNYDKKNLAIFISMLIGFNYGSFYTIYPTLTIFKWGNKQFSKNYGLLMIAPAVGSIISCLQYAQIFDSHCAVNLSSSLTLTIVNNALSTCIQSVYIVTSLQIFIALTLSGFLFKMWKNV